MAKSKFLITIKALDPTSDMEDIVAVAEPLPEGLKPDHPLPEPTPPLVIWGPDSPVITPPIWLPEQKPDAPKPPVIWGGGGSGNPMPTPPIVIPPMPIPPGLWGPNSPTVTPPIYLPPQEPTQPLPPVIGWDPCNPDVIMPPIYLPPQTPGGPNKPPIIWGGGNLPFPTPPINGGGSGEADRPRVDNTLPEAPPHAQPKDR